MRAGICIFCIVAPDRDVAMCCSLPVLLVCCRCCVSFVSVVVGMHFFVVRRQGLTSATELTHTTTNFELNFEFKVEFKVGPQL
jgi:hypothetical protein